MPEFGRLSDWGRGRFCVCVWGGAIGSMHLSTLVEVRGQLLEVIPSIMWVLRVELRLSELEASALPTGPFH